MTTLSKDLLENALDMTRPYVEHRNLKVIEKGYEFLVELGGRTIYLDRDSLRGSVIEFGQKLWNELESEKPDLGFANERIKRVFEVLEETKPRFLVDDYQVVSIKDDLDDEGLYQVKVLVHDGRGTVVNQQLNKSYTIRGQFSNWWDFLVWDSESTRGGPQYGVSPEEFYLPD